MEDRQKNQYRQAKHEKDHEFLDENERLRSELEALQVKYNDLNENLRQKENLEINDKTLINVEVLTTILDSLNEIVAYLSEMDLNAFTMTGAQRRRLQGAGVRRLGFIQKTTEIAAENPMFLQGFLTQSELSNLNTQIGITSNIMLTLQKLLRIMTDHYLLTSDEAYRLSRIYYASVRDAAQNGVPGALPIFNHLRPLFHRPRNADDKPTDAEVERDLKALLHGHKDGEIIVKNVKPHLEGGKHVVIDETHKPEGRWKETEEGEIE